MNRPTRETPGGRAYLDLQNRARRERRPSDELLVLYVLERWLARLAASRHRDSFVLKGGVLLAAFDTRRPTVDIDLLARNLANDHETVAARVAEISQLDLPEDDGVRFLSETMTARTIREDAEYTGVRVGMDCAVATARTKLKLDINVGDPITPAPGMVELPSQRPEFPAVRLLGYPIETVLAEKASTAIALGDTNTRVRDYADIHMLTGKHPVAFSTMREALSATCLHRGVDIRPLSEVVGDLAALRQTAYVAFRRKLVTPDDLPAELADVVVDVVRFIDPLADAAGTVTAWNPLVRRWQ